MARAKRRAAGRVGLDAARAWLELVQTSGPFLTAPVVERVWPQGMPAVPKADRARTRAAVAAMLADHGASASSAIELVLGEVLGWGECLRWRDDIPEAIATHLVETGHTITADFAFHASGKSDDEEVDEDAADEDEPDDDSDEDDDGNSSAGESAGPTTGAGPWRLFGMRVPFGTHPLTRAGTGQWASGSPADRLAVLLRARNVALGLVTDGRWWALVWAPRGKTTGVAVWDADLWSGEPETFEAFVALLTRARFLGVPAKDTLPALLAESSEAAEEVTDTLGRQVREAVELLVGKLDQLDHDSGRALLADVSDDDVYAGVVTMMMRIVFLLFAEERRLLPSDDARYDASYSVGHLVHQLRTRAATNGEQTLEFRTGAWHRLIAVSRAVFRGIHYDDLRIPAYGGGLFDPTRFPWLEGGDATPPAAIDDRTVLRLLSAVQYVTIDGETRRLTFRALDVEQIGYVYEGLLELEVRTAETDVLALKPRGSGKSASKDKTLRHLGVDEALAIGDNLDQWTVTRYFGEKDNATRRSTARKLLASVVPPQVMVGLQDALGIDTAQRLRHVAALVRTDDTDRPIIVRAGGRYVAPSTRRAATGAHYTPRFLAEEVVRHALEPLVFRPGPLETLDETTWRLRPSSEIRTLRVADIAMGSGAFLVAACRWLADKLVEAWDDEGDADAIRARSEKAIDTADAEVSPVVLRARRLIAEHCLYGVDVNPLAVEMAKLSLWLVTMDRERPFGFLDDRLVAGDSLLGVRSLDQLETLHIDPAAGGRMHEGVFDFTSGWRATLAEAADIRRRITATPVTTIRDVEHKCSLLAQAEGISGRLSVVADALTGAGIEAAAEKGRKRDAVFASLALAFDPADGSHRDLGHWSILKLQGGNPAGKESRRPLHWPLVFPEIFADTDHPGFDAIVGNPPFLGGQKISGALGDDYLAWLQAWDGYGRKGSCDLGGRFVLRTDRLLGSRGQLGCVTTNTLIEGATLEVSLLQLQERGDWRLRQATSPHPWPSKSANLQIIEIWASKAATAVPSILDDEPVPNLSVDLQPYLTTTGRPYRLTENEGIAFQGSTILGLGFTMTRDEAADLIERDPRSAEALAPYVIGQDLNRRSDCSASRCVINFRDWSERRAATYPLLMERVARLVKPERAKNNRQNYRDYWWRYAEARPGLHEAVANLDHVLAISLHGNALLPVRVPTGQVFSHGCGVFALEDFASSALLSSSVHRSWVIRYTSTLETRIRYAPSDVFLTLPRPKSTPEVEELGKQLDTERRELMLGRAWGLTRTYNAVHDPAVTDLAIVRLRDIHEQIDYAVATAYGWSDLDLKVGHHETKIGIRWTVSRDARYEILDRLLAENHRRHALESS